MELHDGATCRSQFNDRSSSSASRAMAVVSMWGLKNAPSTTLFPAFQPPSTQRRSISISVPSRILSIASEDEQQPSDCLSAIREKAVGITQLTVPGVHGHPYLSGSNRTLRSAVQYFHFQNQ